MNPFFYFPTQFLHESCRISLTVLLGYEVSDYKFVVIISCDNCGMKITSNIEATRNSFDNFRSFFFIIRYRPNPIRIGMKIIEEGLIIIAE